MKKAMLIVKNNLFKICVLFLIVTIYILNFLLFYQMKINKDDINKNENILSEVALSEKEIENNDEKIMEYIYVDIKGAVKKPNVYKVLKGSRVIDAIKSAGGLNKDANTRFINLSKILNDGDAIVIYNNSEIKKAQKVEKIIVETPCICEEIKNDACYKEEVTNTTEINKNDNSDNSNNKVIAASININTATIEQLMTLTGIGEAKAKSIIKYREENGKFNVIEDIIKVSGISETIFSKIKNNITV